MKKKAKILVSIFSLTLVVVGLFFATTSILASTNHNVGSPFSISYVAPSGVNANVTAVYYTATSDSASVLKNSSDPVLSLSRGTDSGSLSASSSPSLSVNNYYVIFQFGVYNSSLEGRTIKVQMTNECTSTGSLSEYYGTSSSKLVADEGSVIQEEKDAMIACAKNTSGTTGYTLGTDVSLNPGSYIYFYMLVEISDEGGYASNASYISTAQNGVKFILSKDN